MSNYPDDTFLARWLNGELTDEEQKEFEKSEDYHELSRLLKGTEMLQSPNFEGENVLKQIKQDRNRKDTKPQTALRSLRPLFYIGAAAAMIALLLFFFYPQKASPEHKGQHLATLAGEMQSKIFPDNSWIRLNENSEIVYDEKNWSRERKVGLEGEAYFEVEKGAAFTVVTELGSVKVLGTRFNVSTRNDRLDVVCFDGRVEVYNEDASQNQVLTAGESLQIDKGEIRSLEEEDLGQIYPNWLDGIYSAQDISIKEALAAFERIYGVEFEIQNLDVKEIVSVNFYKNDKEKALLQLTGGFQAKYEILSPKKIRIYRE
ncbi:MAG: FecR domain-containing protein [Bacteroidia bacterium]|nr:FecR domain-containing protein [Bacteroidia bacterium]